MSGPQIGERKRIEGTVTLGRDPACGIPLRDTSVSWVHARFVPDGEHLYLEDLGSLHGTWRGGERVAGRIVLAVGDDLEVGTTRLRIELHGPAELLFDRAVEGRLLHDDLTGLLSRRRFDVELDGLVEVAARDHEPLALVVLDLDGLKRVNDTHGHGAGAEVIRAVGTALRLASKAPGCRFGGDEFAFALAEDRAGARRAAQAYLDVVRATSVPWGDHRLTVSASAGFAVMPPERITVDELFHRADLALLAAKRGGRARVVDHGDLPGSP